MLFDTWDAQKIIHWKGQIAAANATFEGLKAEIFHHFARKGKHDPDAVLQRWPDILAVWRGEHLWGALVSGHEETAHRHAQSQGLRLEAREGTPAGSRWWIALQNA